MARGEMDSDSAPIPQDSSNEADQKASSSNLEPAKPVGKGTRSRMDSTTRGEEMKVEALDLISKCYNNLAACIVSFSRTIPCCPAWLTIKYGNIVGERSHSSKGGLSPGHNLLR